MTFFHNHALLHGGAVFIENACISSIQNCHLEDNTVIESKYKTHTSVFKRKCQVLYPAIAGGAIVSHQDCKLQISQTTFDRNQAEQDGNGINALANTSVNVDSCLFTSNVASAITVTSGFVSISNSTFYNNTAPNDGGAVAAQALGTVKISNSTFKENNGFEAGTIFCRASSKFIITSSLFTDNIAENQGGVFWVQTSNVTVHNCTFVKNKAKNSYGGVIRLGLHGNLFMSAHFRGIMHHIMEAWLECSTVHLKLGAAYFGTILVGMMVL